MPRPATGRETVMATFRQHMTDLMDGAFEEHFRKMNTDDDAGVSWAEFLSFCKNEGVAMRKSGDDKKVPGVGHQYKKEAVTHQEVLPWHQGGYEDHHGDLHGGVVPGGRFAAARLATAAGARQEARIASNLRQLATSRLFSSRRKVRR